MSQKNSKPEKDRVATEKRLLDTIESMISEDGFEKIGVNAVAAKASVSKILIYRYFGSVEGLMAAYIRKHDYWINFPPEAPKREELSVFLKDIFYKQVEQLRKDKTLRKLYRWELSTNNDMIDAIRQQREASGLRMIESVSKLTNRPQQEVAAKAAIIAAAITYLVMLGDFCSHYNGIPLKEANGWEQISKGVDDLIDQWLFSLKDLT